MANVEKVSIALPTDMLAMVRQAVDGGQYASSSEVVREALREWKARRAMAAGANAPRVSDSAGPWNTTPPTRRLSFPIGAQQRGSVAALCRRFAVRRLALFGSVLRGDFNASSSDIDVAVRFEPTTGTSPASQYFDFKTALERLFGRTVDLVELDAMPDSRLKRIIERTQLAVYEQAP